MKVVHAFEDVRALSVGRVGLVPTMGFFHEGHLSLIKAAKAGSETVVVSLFVNPLQFNEDSDFDSYPRDFERDAALAESAGADVLFVPDESTMYPPGSVTRVEVRGPAESMEGAARPGHFSGVATVVAKLVSGVQPDRTFFGRKDAQQLAVVHRMARDLSLPGEVVGMPIIRENDGLALSSRNVRLDPSSRDPALLLSRALLKAADTFEAGERSAHHLIEVTEGYLSGEDRIIVEYVELATTCDARVLEASTGVRIEDETFLAVAVRVGGVRLIDNVHFDPASGVADRGTRLAVPSILYGGA